MDIPLPAEPVDPERQRLDERRRLQRGLLLSAGLLLLMWWIAMLQQLFGWDLHALALRPGEWNGLLGVLTAPLLHGSLGHLVANSLPLLLLGTLSYVALPRASGRAWVLIWLLAGVGTWVIGRPSHHLGASGLTHGLMWFLLLCGLMRRDRATIAAAMLAFFFYGGMLLTVLPREAGVSWEYHLCGAAAGVIAALLWSRLDPPPPRKRYSWEDEPEPQPLDQELELPAPEQVPVLWRREASAPAEQGQVVVPFRPRRAGLSDRSGTEPGV